MKPPQVGEKALNERPKKWNGPRWPLGAGGGERTRRLLLEKMKSDGSMLRPIDREPAIGLASHSGGLSPHAKAGMVTLAVCTIFQPGCLAFLEAPVRGLFSTASPHQPQHPSRTDRSQKKQHGRGGCTAALSRMDTVGSGHSHLPLAPCSFRPAQRSDLRPVGGRRAAPRRTHCRWRGVGGARARGTQRGGAIGAAASTTGLPTTSAW